jgi:hypothetical protein
MNGPSMQKKSFQTKIELDESRFHVGKEENELHDVDLEVG